MDILVYTDGACSGNPGPGGWAAVLISGPHRKEVAGSNPSTTNNEMELVAILEGLRALRGGPHNVTVITDSQLAIGWLSQGWKRKAAHLHSVLAEIDQLASGHNTSYAHVNGHGGCLENERADSLARQQAQLACSVQNG